jgi:hypothetical protein
VNCRRTRTRPVSYYALFQGWLLLSQPPGCLRARTSLHTQPALGGLSRRSRLFPSRPRSLAPVVSLPAQRQPIRRLPGVGSLDGPSPQQRATWLAATADAAPQCISGRTSYLRVRLAFHPYPQLLQPLCNAGRFGPPRGGPPASPWPWVAHPVSGRLGATNSPFSDSLALRLHGSCRLARAAPESLAGSFFNRHAITRPRRALTDRALPVSGTLSLPSPGCFSPFPHGTTPLPVAGGTRALEGGPPSFPPRSPCRAVLTDHTTPSYPPPRTGLSPAPASRSRPFR